MDVASVSTVQPFPELSRRERRTEAEHRPVPGTRPQPAPASANETELTEEQRKRLQELREADRRVRAHEQAHLAAAGKYASPPSLKYVTGPDGKQYAVAGEVGIDMSEIPGDPEATARKMEQIQRAAMAPVDPSPQDRRVAAEAAQKKAAAIAEARRRDAEDAEGGRRAPSAPAYAVVRYRMLADRTPAPALLTASA